MATTRQRKLAKVLIENSQLDKPLNGREMLVSVGYSKNVAHKKPAEILESQGVKEALADYGFNEENARKVVGEILNKAKNQPKDRLKAAEMVFKVHGTFAAEKHVNLNLTISKDEREKILGIASQVLDKMTHEEVNG